LSLIYLQEAGKIVVDGEQHAKQINIPIPYNDSFSLLRRADTTGDGHPSDFGSLGDFRSLDRDANPNSHINADSHYNAQTG
jgi:hypothetical protein